MSLYISSINSGSNGNCYYVGNNEEAVLIDAGISCTETERRMNRLKLPLSKVKAIFISHEHADHINGVATISKKYNIPVYITDETLRKSGLKIEKKLINNFQDTATVSIGKLTVTAFKKLHDAADPHSFIVSGGNVTIGIFTDIGYPGKELIRYFRLCHAVFLETNYCEAMLENGSYPRHLKKRISGKKGHLSNTQALGLFKKYKPHHLSHLILSHLSENNNNPEIVKKLFKPYEGDVSVIVASRYQETEVYRINPVAGINGLSQKNSLKQEYRQLKLF
ncbi:MAG: MBL fold metallo-hydrolase [Sphingobacteriales bacterium UTBCD1]|jgi:phosphoribosyl 1,2-cyclic phosphodiesterase|nr:MAG: MBL fold metallo-hydrolase [Sphingobacteriales bacterium UTBCD1]